MNPYEKTASEMKRQSEGPKQFAKTAIAAGSVVGAAAFAPILSKIAPFLSEFIPEDLAIKGLSKINPRVGKFVSDALNGGYDFREIKDFLGEQIDQAKSQEPARQGRNIIEQESPELFTFLDQAIRAGRNPIEAAAIAQNDKRFKPVIEKLMKTHKTPWSSIIEGIFGSGETAQPGQAPVPQPNPQSGQGSQALMAILSKINQRLGG
jgi:hypothetical protein